VLKRDLMTDVQHLASIMLLIKLEKIDAPARIRSTNVLKN